MSTTDTAEIKLDCALTVTETIARYPATSAVFTSYGIDTCCGGGISVEQAARDASLNPVQLCKELETAARNEA